MGAFFASVLQRTLSEPLSGDIHTHLRTIFRYHVEFTRFLRLHYQMICPFRFQSVHRNTRFKVYPRVSTDEEAPSKRLTSMLITNTLVHLCIFRPIFFCFFLFGVCSDVVTSLIFIDRCTICLSDFNEGEDVSTLPVCLHRCPRDSLFCSSLLFSLLLAL